MRALLLAGFFTGFGFVWFGGTGPEVSPVWSLLVVLAGVEAAVFTGGFGDPLEPLFNRVTTGLAAVVLGYGAEHLLNLEVSGYLVAAFVVVILLELGSNEEDGQTSADTETEAEAPSQAEPSAGGETEEVSE